MPARSPSPDLTRPVLLAGWLYTLAPHPDRPGYGATAVARDPQLDGDPGE